MAKSLFQKDQPPEDSAPTPHQMIEKEVAHLKKGTSTRYGPKNKQITPPWLFILLLCGLAWLYVLDPILHAWYKGEAMRTYLYLHNFSSGPLVDELLATHIFTGDEITALDHRTGSFQDYYASPEAANNKAKEIITYFNNLHTLHDGKLAQQPNWLAKVRYALFIRTGIGLPTDWGFLDPSVGE